MDVYIDVFSSEKLTFSPKTSKLRPFRRFQENTDVRIVFYLRCEVREISFFVENDHSEKASVANVLTPGNQKVTLSIREGTRKYF